MPRQPSMTASLLTSRPPRLRHKVAKTGKVPLMVPRSLTRRARRHWTRRSSDDRTPSRQVTGAAPELRKVETGGLCDFTVAHICRDPRGAIRVFRGKAEASIGRIRRWEKPPSSVLSRMLPWTRQLPTCATHGQNGSGAAAPKRTGGPRPPSSNSGSTPKACVPDRRQEARLPS